MPQQSHRRAWGSRFDPLAVHDSAPSSSDDPLPHSQKLAPVTSATAQSDETSHADDRVVHDASIFVGSLPSNVDHTELAVMLTEHFSVYPQAHSIKVVHDSRGGTCAFIQCQDATSATTFLQTLRSSTPRLFMGRYLRYEPARAFRTLRISYRSPRQYKQNAQTGSIPKKADMAHLGDNEFIELGLPTAMKLVKIPGTRRVTILYNADAVADGPADRNDCTSLLLVPVLYDADTLMKIATVFGPVEHFGPYMPEDTRESLGHPNPHDGPRCAVMDPGCWEVKWCHRDDCTSALMTLRRVPHLTVTWAHRTVSETSGQRKPYGVHPTFQGHVLQSRRDGDVQRDFSTTSVASVIAIPREFPGRCIVEGGSPVHPVGPSIADLSTESKETSSSTPDTRSQHCRPRALSLNYGHPPASLPAATIQTAQNLARPHWGFSLDSQWVGLPAKPHSSPRITSSMTFGGFLSPRAVPIDCGATQSDDEKGSEDDVPLMAKFGVSPVTRNMPESFVHCTPNSSGDSQSTSFQGPNEQEIPPAATANDSVLGCRSIFVGGLEIFGPDAWDERKIQAFFLKHGRVESIKFIRPTNKRYAFAFVQFDNAESAVRAVHAEHKRIVCGRSIRVQLQDVHLSQRAGRSDSFKEPECREPEPPIIPLGVSQENPSHEKTTDIGNVIEHVYSLKLADISVEGSGPSSPPINASDSSQSIPTDFHRSQSANICSSGDPDVHESRPGVLSTPSDGPQEKRGADNAFPGKTNTSRIQFPHVAVPLPTVAHSAPTMAYYPPQGWMPGYGSHYPYQQPFFGQPYTSYPLPPYSMPRFAPGNSGKVGGASPSTLGPTPLSGTPETAPAPTMVYPVGRGAAHRHPGVFQANPYMQAPLVSAAFFQGNQGMLIPTYPADALNHCMAGNRDEEPTQMPGNTDMSGWQPCPPPAHTQPQPFFFQPFSHPLLYPGHPGGPHGWHPGYSWQGPGVAHQPVHAQCMPSEHQFALPPGPRTNMGRGKFERTFSSRRQSRKDHQPPFPRNNPGPRGPLGRQVRTVFTPRAVPEPLPT